MSTLQKIIKTAGFKEIPIEGKKRQRPHITEWLEGLFKDRENALLSGDLDEVKEITKQIKKWMEHERKEFIHVTIDKDLDVRSKWAGIRQLKTPYKPIPYAQKRKGGTQIRVKDRAEEAATFSNKKSGTTREKRETQKEKKSSNEN